MGMDMMGMEFGWERARLELAVVRRVSHAVNCVMLTVSLVWWFERDTYAKFSEGIERSIVE